MKIIDLAKLSAEIVAQQAATALKAGQLVIFPTETTYGAGVDATNPEAVKKLLAYKARREGKPLSIAVTDIAMAEKYVEINDSARRSYQRFLPGPVTVISRGKGVVAPGVESEFGTLGIRIPAYPLVLEIVKVLGQPITSTSANGSGEKRPYSISDIFDNLSGKQKSLIDLVLDAGTLPQNPPSTVIDTTLSTPVTLRAGEIKLETENAKLITLTSTSEQETKDIAKRLLLKNWDNLKNHGLVIGLDGALGSGKTIFTKGVAEFLQIQDIITSPTYIYLEEYGFERHEVTGHLYHLDVWKIETEADFHQLEIQTLFGKKTVIVIEWFNQIKPWIIPMIENSQVPLLQVVFSDKVPGRELQIAQPKS